MRRIPPTSRMLDLPPSDPSIIDAIYPCHHSLWSPPSLSPSPTHGAVSLLGPSIVRHRFTGISQSFPSSSSTTSRALQLKSSNSLNDTSSSASSSRHSSSA
ncbi:hypothetical protein BDN70DRAFT_454185 [Pholiota conissans]|uniref:Uncharacterized protein n=1 Tax=Pholiota conissans TaxID=109636 RepID=A0A9P5YML6_9AGAR|nr:hypothetical protein BDN70DRAFT_454185 [Pholiota conissans]